MYKRSSYTSQAKLTRVESMKWWNNLSTNTKRDLTEFYHPKRDYRSLTGFEIQKIACKRH